MLSLLALIGVALGSLSVYFGMWCAQWWIDRRWRKQRWESLPPAPSASHRIPLILDPDIVRDGDAGAIKALLYPDPTPEQLQQQIDDEIWRSSQRALEEARGDPAYRWIETEVIRG